MKLCWFGVVAAAILGSSFTLARQAATESRSTEPSTPTADSNRPLRIRVSEGVARKLLVKKVPASYPADARRKLIQGDVELKVLIDTNGAVKDVALLSGPAALAPAAIEAVKQWKYKPYLLNGQPVTIETQVTVSFSLSLSF